MEFKISVKTILLFTALFILGTMILGFYSCSSNTTPVSPQLSDEFTDEIINPADGVTTIVNEDGTITIIDSNGDTTTITAPGTITMEDGTTIITYIVAFNEDGNLIIVDPRESAGVSGVPDGTSVEDDLVDLEFSPFVQDGELWTGNVMVVNHSNSALLFPRVVFGKYVGSELDSQSSGFILVDFLDTLVNPDIYYGLYRDAKTPVTAYPTIFIADEDESYTVGPGESAEHEISIRFNPEASEYFEVNLAYQIDQTGFVPAGFDSELWDDIPIGIDIELVEYVDEASRIAITLDADPYWGLGIIPVLVEETLYGEVTSFVFSEYNEFDQPVYKGIIRWNPEEDGPINVMAYFRPKPVIGVSLDSFMDFTTLTLD